MSIHKIFFTIVVMLFTNCADSSNPSVILEPFNSGLDKNLRLNELTDQQARLLENSVDRYIYDIDTDPRWKRANCMFEALRGPDEACDWAFDRCMEVGYYEYLPNSLYESYVLYQGEPPTDRKYAESQEYFNYCDYSVGEYEECVGVTLSSRLSIHDSSKISCFSPDATINEVVELTFTNEVQACFEISNCTDGY